jgi:hypothetical protein
MNCVCFQYSSLQESKSGDFVEAIPKSPSVLNHREDGGKDEEKFPNKVQHLLKSLAKNAM